MDYVLIDIFVFELCYVILLLLLIIVINEKGVYVLYNSSIGKIKIFKLYIDKIDKCCFFWLVDVCYRVCLGIYDRIR